MDRTQRATKLIALARKLLAKDRMAAESQSGESLTALLKARVDSLLDLRVALRKDSDKLHAAYEDATGGYGGGVSSQGGGFAAHANPAVKEARDALHKLDNEIGTTYRTLEHLMREISKASKAKGAGVKSAADHGQYVVQYISHGRIVDEDWTDDEDQAVRNAKGVHLEKEEHADGGEYTNVRVLTIDGELVYERKAGFRGTVAADKVASDLLNPSKKTYSVRGYMRGMPHVSENGEGSEDKNTAIAEAREMLKEFDYVKVTTPDGYPVWDSRYHNKSAVSEKTSADAPRRVYHYVAAIKGGEPSRFFVSTETPANAAAKAFSKWTRSDVTLWPTDKRGVYTAKWFDKFADSYRETELKILEEVELGESKKAAPGAHQSQRPWRFKVHVGPVGIKEYAEKFQEAGIPVSVIGTENLHVDMDGSTETNAREAILEALRDAYGPAALGIGSRDIKTLEPGRSLAAKKR